MVKYPNVPRVLLIGPIVIVELHATAEPFQVMVPPPETARFATRVSLLPDTIHEHAPVTELYVLLDTGAIGAGIVTRPGFHRKDTDPAGPVEHINI
jgi:hypothetical protein